ncbi:hypothetical protein [Geodermatophilus sp. URMC 60]
MSLRRDLGSRCALLIVLFVIFKLVATGGFWYYIGALVNISFILLAAVAILITVLQVSELQRVVGLVAVALSGVWLAYWTATFYEVFPLWELLTVAGCYLAQIGPWQGHRGLDGGVAHRS